MFDIMNVCRLCSRTDQLISIFDNGNEMPADMQHMIFVMTGINIMPSDNVSRKICHWCTKIIKKIFTFRTSSIINNKELQEKARAKGLLKPEIHKSVQLLLKQYPKITLPPSIVYDNIYPKVVADKNEISIWLERQKMQKEIKRTKTNKTTLANERLNEGSSTSLTNNKIRPEIPAPHIKKSSPKSSPGFPEVGPQVYEQSFEHSTHEKVKVKREWSSSLKTPKAKKSKLVTDIKTENSKLESKYVLPICDIDNGAKMNCSTEEAKGQSKISSSNIQMTKNSPEKNLSRCDDKSEEIKKEISCSDKKRSRPRNKQRKITEYYMGNESEIINIKPVLQDSTECEDKVINLIPDGENEPILLISDEEDSVKKMSNKPENYSSSISESVLSNEKSSEPSDYKRNSNNLGSSTVLNTACLRPEMKIIGSDVLDVDFDDEDITLLKNLIRKMKTKEMVVQTDMPRNEDILPNGQSFILKNLYSFLNFYGIPIKLSYAPSYSVKYSLSSSPTQKTDHSLCEINRQLTKTTRSLNNQPYSALFSATPTTTDNYSSQGSVSLPLIQ